MSKHTNLFVGGSASSDSNDGNLASNAFGAVYNTYWQSANTAVDHWLKYDLGSGNAKVVNKYMIQASTSAQLLNPKDFKFQGSNNDSDWTDLDIRSGIEFGPGFNFVSVSFSEGKNTTAYRYYRLYITDNNTASSDAIRIYNFEGMNDTSDPQSYGESIFSGGTPSASSVQSGSSASNAFDGSVTTEWQSDFSSSLPQWLKYDLGSGGDKILNKYILSVPPSTFADNPFDWKLQGSNNDSDWTDLDVRSSLWLLDFGDRADKICITDFSEGENTTSFRYYRLYITDTVSSGPDVRIANWEGMEKDGYQSNFLIDGISDGGIGEDSQYQLTYPEYAFDNIYRNFFWADNLTNCYLTYDLGSGITKIPAKMTLKCDPFLRAWTLYGSNLTSPDKTDDLDWTSITSGESSNDDFEEVFTFSNTNAYRHFRLKFTSQWSTPRDIVTQWQLHEAGLNEVDENESLDVSENIQLQEARSNTEVLDIFESSEIKAAKFVIDGETLEVLESSSFLSEYSPEETLIITEDSVISQSLEKVTETETLEILEDANIRNTGKIDYIYNTDLRVKVREYYKYSTYLITNIQSSFIYDTKLITKFTEEEPYNTDLRVRFDGYDSISLGTLDDIIVKLDGSELTDVDYSSLRISWELNSKPSYSTFILGRRHDQLDTQLDGTPSEITNENKIEIFDGSEKIFTGYVTQINAQSTTDTVQVTAEDIRYKFKRTSVEIEYGGEWQLNENYRPRVPGQSSPNAEQADYYTKFEKNVGTAITEVVSSVSHLISGNENIPFIGSHVPEYNKLYNDAGSLLDTLIKQTANADWYIDENEVLRFRMLGSGQIKDLPLSSLNKHRHAYDVIISDVDLNFQKPSYAKSFNVKLGTNIEQQWSRVEFSGWEIPIPEFYRSLPEKTNFCFQSWGDVQFGSGDYWYCGVNKRLYGFTYGNGWFLKAIIKIQYLNKDIEEDLSDITVGSGSPRKTIFLNSYGKKVSGIRWEEKIPEDAETPYLVYVQDENYDHTAYAREVAEFDLSQNNELQTSARASLLLDAFHYYNITFKDRINLSNTINPTIYKNNNGFPLNIQRIEFSGANRTVLLQLTNEGKSAYVKTANYLANFSPAKERYILPVRPVVEYSDSLGGGS